MQQIQIKTANFLYDWVLNNLEVEVELNHILMAYLYGITEGEGKEDFNQEKELQYVINTSERLRKAALLGLEATEAIFGKHHFRIVALGRNVFRDLMFQIMGEELGGMMEKLSVEPFYYKWVAFAYMHRGKESFEETLRSIIYAYQLEQERVREIGLISDPRYQQIQQQALNAYRFYTIGVC